MEADSSGKVLRFGTLALLYFVQGAPYGFQVGCLPLILRKAGLSFSQLGAMKLLFVPWVCKPLYAPIVERTRSRLWWLLVSMSVLGITCLASACTSPDMIFTLILALFLLNLASATQDICVDSLALNILKPDELGAGNTVQVVAYKCGSVFAGGTLLWMKDSLGWAVMWVGFSSIYFICIFLITYLNLVAPHNDDKDDASTSSVETKETKSVITLVKENLSEVFKVEGTWWIVSFVLFYKLCERGESVFPIYLVDKGVSMSKMAFWNGIVRAIASVSGSSYSGYLLSSKSVKVNQVLLTFTQWRCLPILVQSFIIRFWGYSAMEDEQNLDRLSLDSCLFFVSIASLCISNFFAGVLTTAAFTKMMTISQAAPNKIRSTHYSFLATMEVLGKLCFATVCGALIDLLGLGNVYLLFVLTAFLTIPLLWRMPSSEKQTCQS